MLSRALLSLPLLFGGALSLSRFSGRELPGQVSYAGHTLVSAKVGSVEQYRALERAYEDPSLHLDLWTGLQLGQVEVLLPPGSLTSFTSLGLEYEVISHDVQASIDERNMRRALRGPAAPSLNQTWFEEYHDLDEIRQWMDELVGAFPSLCSKFTLGTSYLGEEIQGLKISGARSSRSIVYHGGQHSNEWIGPAVTSYLIHQLLTGYESDTSIKKMVDGFEWYIAPVLNVDGYRYTWSTNSGWRKNRQPNEGSACVGIDPNRNWPYKWNTGGSSSEPCSNSYHGPEPFTAPEPRSVSDFIEALQRSGKEVVSYIDWHCCGLMWMNPWGYTCDDFPQADVAQKDAGATAVAAAKAVHGVNYAMGNICDVIYQASGSSADHVYGNLNVTYSYAIELRSNSQFDPSKIIPNGEEMWAAVRAYVSDLL